MSERETGEYRINEDSSLESTKPVLPAQFVLRSPRLFIVAIRPFLSSVLVGLAIGTLLCVLNILVLFKTGSSFGGSALVALLGAGLLRLLNRLDWPHLFIVFSLATSGYAATAALDTAVGAVLLGTSRLPTTAVLILLATAANLVGVGLGILIARVFVFGERLPYPTLRPAITLMATLTAKAGRFKHTGRTLLVAAPLGPVLYLSVALLAVLGFSSDVAVLGSAALCATAIASVYYTYAVKVADSAPLGVRVPTTRILWTTQTLGGVVGALLGIGVLLLLVRSGLIGGQHFPAPVATAMTFVDSTVRSSATYSGIVGLVLGIAGPVGAAISFRSQSVTDHARSWRAAASVLFVDHRARWIGPVVGLAPRSDSHIDHRGDRLRLDHWRRNCHGGFASRTGISRVTTVRPVSGRVQTPLWLQGGYRGHGRELRKGGDYMIAIANLEEAEVQEKQPDCCTALRGRKNLDVQTNVMVADPEGCE